MKRVISVVALVVGVLWTADIVAQGRNFSGAWTIDIERTLAAAPAGGGVVARGGGGGGGGARGGGGGGTVVGAGGAVAGGAGGGMRSGGGGGGRGGGGPMTIAMDANSFTMGAGETTTVYRLDGSTSTIQTPRGEATAKAAWNGDKLVIETSTPGQNGPMVTLATWYLEGDALVRETTTPMPDGQAVTRKTYYKKA